MCGIAGMACLPGYRPDPEILDRMAQALRHRGPDGGGLHRTDTAALVHRRLSIVDLEGGAQPLVHGAVALVANGEIYNDPALRHVLADAPFRTGSDCESPCFSGHNSMRVTRSSCAACMRLPCLMRAARRRFLR